MIDELFGADAQPSQSSSAPEPHFQFDENSAYDTEPVVEPHPYDVEFDTEFYGIDPNNASDEQIGDEAPQPQQPPDSHFKLDEDSVYDTEPVVAPHPFDVEFDLAFHGVDPNSASDEQIGDDFGNQERNLDADADYDVVGDGDGSNDGTYDFKSLEGDGDDGGGNNDGTYDFKSLESTEGIGERFGTASEGFERARVYPNAADDNAIADLLEEADYGAPSTVWTEIAGDARSDFAEQRAAMGAPIVHRFIPKMKSRDWQVDFGPVFAPAGFVTTIEATPQCLFRGEKIVATDSATTVGTGTRIMSVTIGTRVQRPGNGSTLTTFFASSALANGITFDTTRSHERVSVQVSFVQTCTFDMTVFGSAVVEE